MSELRKEFEKIAYKNKWNINKDPHDFYVDDFVNGAWWAFEEQQAKIDELKKLRSLDEMTISQLAQANQVWQSKCNELQARVDESLEYLNNLSWASELDVENVTNILKGNKDGN